MANPFERGIFGQVYNTLFGPGVTEAAETRAAGRLREAGEVRGGLAKRVGAMAQQGLPPERIWTQLMQDPDFSEAFSTGDPQEFQGLMSELIAATQQATPQVSFAAPGSTVFTQRPGEGPQRGETLPTEGMLEFEAGVPAGGSEGTQAERATFRLLRKGLIDETERDDILAGNLEVVTQFSPVSGEPIGSSLVNRRTRQQIRMIDQQDADLDFLSGGPEPGAERLPANTTGVSHQLQQAPQQLQQTFLGAANQTGVPVDLLVSMAAQESQFNQGAVSPKGAVGVMQLLPSTAADYQMDPNDPSQNIMGGALHMSRLLKQYGGNTIHALAAYNWGEGRVNEWLQRGGDWSQVPAETREYVRNILSGTVPGVTPGPTAQTGEAPLTTGVPSGAAVTPGTEAAFATGPAPALSEFVGKAFGGFEPGSVNEEVVRGRESLRILRESILDYERNAGREALQAQQRMLAIAPTTGFFTSPIESLNKLLVYRHDVERELKGDLETVRNIHMPKSIKAEAWGRITSGRKLLAAIGTEAQLRSALQSARTLSEGGRLKGVVSQILPVWQDVQAQAGRREEPLTFDRIFQQIQQGRFPTMQELESAQLSAEEYGAIADFIERQRKAATGDQ